MRSTLFALGCLGVMGALACAPADGRVASGGPDRASFGPVAKVLVARCGSIDCHGSTYRNMRLYGYESARLDPTALPDSPNDTTPGEIDADYDAVVALEPDITRAVVADKGASPERLTFVRKGFGEEDHKGGQRIVPGSTAAACVTSWLASAVDTGACTTALTAP